MRVRFYDVLTELQLLYCSRVFFMRIRESSRIELLLVFEWTDVGGRIFVFGFQLFDWMRYRYRRYNGIQGFVFIFYGYELYGIERVRVSGKE